MVGEFGEIDEATDEEIEAAVVVVIEPDGARGPAGCGYAGFFGDVGEGAVAVVAIEDAATVLRDVEIGEAVGVVVAYSDAHAIAAAGDASFLCDVGEGAVAIVVVEGVAEGNGRSPKIAGAAVDQIDVDPAVVVVVEEGAAGAGGFGEIFLEGVATGVDEIYAGSGGENFGEGETGAGIFCCGDGKRRVEEWRHT